MELSNLEKRVLLAIKEAGKDEVSTDEILEIGKFSQMVEVMNALSWLRVKGLVKIREKMDVEYCLNRDEELPEVQIYEILKERRELEIRELFKILPKNVVTVGMGHLRKMGIPLENGKLKFVNVDDEIEKRKNLLSLLRERCLKEGEVDLEIIKDLLRRKGLIKKKERIIRYVSLTNLGRKILDEGIEIKEEITQLTPELIQTGKWRDYELKRYDVGLFAPRMYSAKPHPLTQIIEKIRRIFLMMGFDEVQGEYVVSAFWDMDALFIPQDHPAREMQDTFYLKKPARIPIEDRGYMLKVKDMHENGGGISRGWRYEWSEEIAERAMLRTHTTVNSIRYLYEHRKPPVRMFSIGRVFRRENMDSTHLPEFTQIEGIYMDEDANFQVLLGILKEFYSLMGFPTIRFRPSYFPYTEPSLEVEVYYNDQWLELGGAGIFRPEVTEPLGIEYPVLAWGLGLERLAMIILGLKDIRDLYISDIDWLRNQPLLR
ncbi:phenylalanyl-tRNA synthetase, alpha subunit [Aciduliprofundum sp. MAR08-339]|uniref:phenylalanine--tRNA ligase subunit alpha n=1 Tax=Aciduliprofundum sp. (strain MAR08-339) TaxID=673860 RepID=UPI0002A4B15A|nr:phenylalanyl-tRNA synthetase, alpha subunit [Aciduliprofundum sp. MAR08-339]